MCVFFNHAFLNRSATPIPQGYFKGPSNSDLLWLEILLQHKLGTIVNFSSTTNCACSNFKNQEAFDKVQKILGSIFVRNILHSNNNPNNNWHFEEHFVLGIMIRHHLHWPIGETLRQYGYYLFSRSTSK